MTVSPSLHKKLERELTHKVPSYNSPEEFVEIKNLKVINFDIQGKLLVAFPVGRIDLIPKDYEIVDKRATNEVDFPEFKFTLRDSQKFYYDQITDNCILNARVGWGKAQPRGSKVKVPTGWKNIEDIVPGDIVTTPQNKPTRVLGVFPHKHKPIYEITFQDGRTARSCGEHLWRTIDGNNVYKNLTVEEILDNRYFKNKRLYIPLVDQPITEEVEQELPIHPYLLGSLIGDGGFTTAAVVFSTADEESIDSIRKLLPNNHEINKINNAKYDYRITSPLGHPNAIMRSLKQLGLKGCRSENKFIPDIYMTGTLEQKLSLLQGLFDTDGYVDKGNKIEFSSSSEKLAKQVQELIFSLGGQCPLRTKIPRYQGGKTGLLHYIVSPQRLPYDLKSKLFTLKRKVSLIRPGQYDNSNKLRIEKIEFIGNQDCWCISIEDDEELYITDNYLVTHNTFWAIAAAAKLKQKTLIVVHTVALRNQWEKEIEKTLGIKPGVIGSGKFNTDSPIVVANVQSLVKNIPRINRMFGTLILDEMHHVSSPTFSKVVDAMFSRYKIGLSGTVERKDGKHIVFNDYFGSTVYKPVLENTMTPKVEVISTGIHFGNNASLPWVQRVNLLKESVLYRELVVKLTDHYASLGHRVLLVSDRVGFLEYCHENTENKSELFTGKVKSEEEREKIIKNIEEGKSSILCGTQSMVSEGLSINPLSCLILGTPLNNTPLLEQLIGRIIRKAPGKLEPIIVDLRLEGYTVANQYNTRLGHYMKSNYDISFIK